MAENDLRYPRLGDELGPGAATGRGEPARRYDQRATRDIFEGIQMPGAKRGRKEDLQTLKLDWDLTADREQVWKTMRHNAGILHG
jgi:hypothetical protein